MKISQDSLCLGLDAEQARQIFETGYIKPELKLLMSHFKKDFNLLEKKDPYLIQNYFAYNLVPSVRQVKVEPCKSILVALNCFQLLVIS